jgi:formamidopyrimidine-DNA glycosylase
MPELPEVETVARRLQTRLPGATIRGADVRWARTVAYPQPAERFELEVAGSTVERVGRRAKSVVLYLADGRVLTVALRMTGALLIAAPGTAPDPHARVVFDLSGGSASTPVGAAGAWPTSSRATAPSRWRRRSPPAGSPNGFAVGRPA